MNSFGQQVFEVPNIRKRRFRGEGTIVARKDGRFVARVELAPDKDGRRRHRFAYARSRKDAIVALERLRAEVASEGTGKPEAGTVADFFDRWLRDRVRDRVRPNTYDVYESAYRIHIKPYLGALPLEKVGDQHVRDLLDAAQANGKSDRGTQIVHSVLKRALHQAVRWGVLEKNPALLVDPPRYEAPQITALSFEEVGQLLRAAKGDRLEALYTLAVYTGLRQGEIFALKWEDLDLERGDLRVLRSLSIVDKKLTVGELKRRNSRRTISLPKPVIAALREHKKNSLSQEWIFTNSEGGQLRASNLRSQRFLPLLKKAGLRRIRFHDLRHSAATMMLSIGVHPKIVAEMLGHARVTVTMDVYAHVLPSMQKDAMTLVNREIAKRTKPKP